MDKFMQDGVDKGDFMPHLNRGHDNHKVMLRADDDPQSVDEQALMPAATCLHHIGKNL